jgi:RNA-directed DNA polymerase
MEQAILRKWLKAGFMDKHVLYPTEAGVPQGGVASPVIMNLALNGLERYIQDAVPTSQGGIQTKVHVIRFADDFIATGHSKAFLEAAVQPLIEQFLAERGLALSHEKTRITHIEDGFDFLGIVRHEVAYTAVMTQRGGHNLVCCHQYPTQTCGWSNPAV